MALSTADILRFEAENARVRMILDIWDAEIQASFERLRREADAAAIQEVEDRKIESAQRFAKETAQAAQTAALAAAVERYLQGLVLEASANDSSAVTVPSGLRVAGPSGSSAALGHINSLIAAADREVLEGRADSPEAASGRSAKFALQHGFLPHPLDLAILLDGHGLSSAWSDRFRALGLLMSEAETRPQFQHPQLKVTRAATQLDHLRDHVGGLKEFQPDRLVLLISSPARLRGSQIAPPSLKTSVRAALSEPDFLRMMSDLGFGRSSLSRR